MSDTQQPAYTRTNVQRFVSLLAADDKISRHAYALLESAGEISYDEMATYRAEAYATSVELQNAKKHLELAENALQREQGQLAGLIAENDFLKEKVCELGGVIEGFTPRSKVTHTCDLPISRGTYTYTWTVKPLPEEPKPAAETPKNPFASYVAPKKEQKYRELGPQEAIQQGDEFQYYAPTTHGKPNDDWYPVLHEFGVKPYQWHGSVLYRRPITEKDAE
jgi:hypothetical protein